MSTYLGTEVEVAEEDGGLRAGDHQDQVNQEQEPIPILSYVLLFRGIKLKEVKHRVESYSIIILFSVILFPIKQTFLRRKNTIVLLNDPIFFQLCLYQ